MAIDYNNFIHPSDKKALEALKKVPGFDFVTKKIMSICSERVAKLLTTSSMIKLSEKQMPEIYNILLKVCKRLEIEVPDLYVTLDRSVNAYTFGDTQVSIVLHSGLLETLSYKQIETVIAHECGHILCHHVLYHTMGRVLLGGADLFANSLISRAAIMSLQYAYFYWNRCSEFSADRVAAYYHNDAQPVVNTMMALCGATNNLTYKVDVNEFLEQAKGYKELVTTSKYNKVLEFLVFGENTHPLTAYRAYEIKQFFENENYTEFIMQIPELIDVSNLTIEYKFIKNKNVLKFGKMFDNESLKVKINDKDYEIEKNKSINIELDSNEYEIEFIKNKIIKKHKIVLYGDLKITVEYDANKEEFNIY